MYEIKTLIQLLEPYSDAYSIELRKVLIENIGKSYEDLKKALCEIREKPQVKLHKLYSFGITWRLSEILFPCQGNNGFMIIERMNDDGMKAENPYSYPVGTDLYLGNKIEQIDTIEADTDKGYFVEINYNDFKCRDLRVKNELEIELLPRNEAFEIEVLPISDITAIYPIERISPPIVSDF